MATPRPRYTYFVEFILSTGIPDFSTTVKQFIDNQRIYAHLKSIDVPKPAFKTDTLRSYNRYYRLQTKIDYEPFSIVLHDDATSMSMALVKEYLNFAHWTGGIGTANGIAKNDPFTYGLSGPRGMASGGGTAGADPRSSMDVRPSLGMRLRDCGRVFFDQIIIYDLGTEPSSNNIYVYVNPMISKIDHTPLEYGSKDIGEVTLTFEYEGMYMMVGESKNNTGVPEAVLGVTGTTYPDRPAHAKTQSSNGSTAAQCYADCNKVPTATNEFLSRLRNFTADSANPGSSDNVNTTEPYIRDLERSGTNTTTAPDGTQYLNASAPSSLTDMTSYYTDRLDRAQTNYVNQFGINGDQGDPELRAIRAREVTTLQGIVSDLTTYRNLYGAESSLTNANPQLAQATENTSTLLNTVDTSAIGAAVFGTQRNADAATVASAANSSLQQELNAFITGAANADAKIANARSPAERARYEAERDFNQTQARRLQDLSSGGLISAVESAYARGKTPDLGTPLRPLPGRLGLVDFSVRIAKEAATKAAIRAINRNILGVPG